MTSFINRRPILALSLMLLGMALVGLPATYYLSRPFNAALRADGWKESECFTINLPFGHQIVVTTLDP